MSDKPILTPFAELLSSRKFVLATAIIVVNTLIQLVPELRPHADVLSFIVTMALGYVLLHISVEDIIKLRQDGLPTPDAATTDFVQEIEGAVIKVIQEMLTPPAAPAPNTTTVNVNPPAEAPKPAETPQVG